jgi:DnaK suppressor protein
MKKTAGSRNGLEKYRNLLFSKRSELNSSLRAKLEALAAPESAAPEDLAPIYHDQFVALQLNHFDSMQLKMVDAALDRMDGGEYGLCADCGEPISGKRLEAIPWAVRCVSCQERWSPARESPQWVELVA